MGKRWTETGKGSRGSVFVRSDGATARATKTGRTLGGLQKWKIRFTKPSGKRWKTKEVYLKRRSELRKVIK